jgi:hypothetical protein
MENYEFVAAAAMDRVLANESNLSSIAAQIVNMPVLVSQGKNPCRIAPFEMAKRYADFRLARG